MPSMYEIYDKYSFEYDELVSREDYRGNLKSWLSRECCFAGKSVIEFGCGTGRLTAMYAVQAASVRCFDRSGHMLGKAESNLAAVSDRISFGLCDNSEIDRLDFKADIVIEGWSFGHTVDDSDDYEKTADFLTEGCKRLLNPGGRIILVESLGTACETPAAPTPALAAMFRRLEETHGFIRTVLSTDYKFDSIEDAGRITGFFFGDEFAGKLEVAEDCIVREFTGVWTAVV